MKRIIDPTKIILRDDEVLLEVKVVSNTIITPETTQGVAFDYLVIVAKGKGVDNFEIGDIVIDIQQQGVYGFTVNNIGYAKCPRHAIIIAVKPDNFNNVKKSELLN